MPFAKDLARSAAQKALYDIGKASAGAVWGYVTPRLSGWLQDAADMSAFAAWLWIVLASAFLGFVGFYAWHAWYARTSKTRIAIHSARWIRADSKDVKAMLSGMVESGKLDVIVNRDLLGDPFPGERKCLTIVCSTDDGPPTELVYNEGEHVAIG
jgi:hypothetical protein